MAGKTREEGVQARYVLGGLSERERERIEEQYFGDDEAFEQMLIAEEELIDAYARGELSAEERARFEAQVLSTPQGRERVQFARSLAGAVSDARHDEAAPKADDVPRPGFMATLLGGRGVLRLAFAAAALVAVVGLAWLLFERTRTREESQPLRAELTPTVDPARELESRPTPEQAQGAQVSAPTEAERVQPTSEPERRGVEAGSQKSDAVNARRAPRRVRKSDTLDTADAATGRTFKPRRIDELPPGRQAEIGLDGSVTFDLTSGLVRGGGATTLAVPGNATFILLRLNLETESSHENYRAVIETADEKPVWRADSFKPRRPTRPGEAIDLPPVPARDVPPGDYILLLSGLRPDGSSEGVADYSFRVVRK